MKSARWATRSSSSAASSAAGSSARIMRRTMGSRSSARNMCSVRHRPMPSAPMRRPLAASGPLSALARTWRWPSRMSSAHAEQGLGLGRGLRLRQRHLAEHHLSGGAVERDPVTLVYDGVAHPERRAGDADGFGPHHGRLPPAAGHHRGVADKAAPGGEDPLRGQHAVDVLGRRLAAHEDHLLAAQGGCLGVVGGEVRRGPRPRPARPRGPWSARRGSARRTADAAPARGGRRSPGRRPRPGQADAGVLGHVHGHAQRGAAGALAHPGLQHPQLALIDGELGVAHVAVVVPPAG